MDVPTLLTEYRNRVPLIHAKDGPLVEGQPHTAVGSGKMDIPACLNAADPDTLQWVMVELDNCATDMMAAVRESYDFLTGNKLAKGNR